MDSDKMPTVEEEFLDALDVLWRQHGNDDPGYKAMLPFVKQIAELQAEANEQARLNGMGAEREARLMAQVAELQAKRDALAKDAARYRWLRSEWTRLNCIPTKDGPGLELATTRWAEFPPDAVDSEIDAAMSKGEQ